MVVVPPEEMQIVRRRAEECSRAPWREMCERAVIARMIFFIRMSWLHNIIKSAAPQ